MICDGALTIATGSVPIAWLTVPGGMLALGNVGPDDREALLIYGGMALNLALRAAQLYPLVVLIGPRFGRYRAAA